MDPGHGILSPQAEQHDLEQLQGVDENGCHGDDTKPFLDRSAPIRHPQPNRKADHDHHQGGYEQQVLPGHISFGLAGKAAPSEKFFQNDTFLFD